MDVSRHILVLDTSILKSINMNQREYGNSVYEYMADIYICLFFCYRSLDKNISGV
jgi:hypothetical protein